MNLGAVGLAVAAAAAVLLAAGVFAMLRLRAGLVDARRTLARQAAESAAGQARMRESRQRLQLLLDHMPDGVLAFDSLGRVEWINPAARLMFQCSIDDAVGQPVKQWIPEVELLTAPAAAPSGALAAAAPRIATKGLRRDGSQFPLELALVSLDERGARAGMCVCRDLSDAERVDRMKMEFLSIVSHELRTPLTSLRGSLALLADGSVLGLPADAQRLLRMANANSERLVLLVNDILDFEKLRAGAMKVELESLDLGDAARQAVESIEGMARQAGVALQVIGAEDAMPVRADPLRLAQVLGNLLSNAIKYSPPASVVRVLLERRGERVRLTVQDQGPGVAPSFVDRLFEPFEQARSTGQRKQGGSGLGLAISRGLMTMMQGAIGLNVARPGEGASFWIELLLDFARPSTFGDLD